MHSNPSFETLVAAGLALVDTSDLVDSDYVWSNRVVSQVDLTVTLALRADFSDDLHTGTYIGQLDYTYGLDVDGDGSDDITGTGSVTD